jgi:hypothetical protein
MEDIRAVILRDYLAMEEHKLRMYSAYPVGWGKEVPKIGYENDYASAKERVEVLGLWLNEIDTP